MGKMQTPDPEPVNAVKDTSIIELEDRLDKLWEGYLVLLDHYMKAQDEIKEHMNSGFLSLAKAQSSAPFGRRYGHDWYDERMKSTKKVHVSSDASEITANTIAAGLQSLSISLKVDIPDTLLESPAGEAAIEKDKAEPTQQPSPRGTPEPNESQQFAENEKSDEKERPKPVNPLRWYGVLVPRELRKAQSSFCMLLGSTRSTEESADSADSAPDKKVSPITNAVNAARSLREIEVELRKVRKAVRKAEKARVMSSH
jgi:hypothetical protein